MNTPSAVVRESKTANSRLVFHSVKQARAEITLKPWADSERWEGHTGSDRTCHLSPREQSCRLSCSRDAAASAHSEAFLFFCWFRGEFFNRLLILRYIPVDSAMFSNSKGVIPVANLLMSGTRLWVFEAVEGRVPRWRSFWLPPFLTSQFDTLPLSRASSGSPSVSSPSSFWQSTAAPVAGLEGGSGPVVSAEMVGPWGSVSTGFSTAFPSGTERSNSFGQGEEATEFPVKGVSTGTSESLLPPSACCRAAQICLCCSSSSSSVRVSSSMAAVGRVWGESLGVSGGVPFGSGGVKRGGGVPCGSGGGVPGGNGGWNWKALLLWEPGGTSASEKAKML